MMEQRLGSSAFRLRTGADNARVRILEALGIISPSKSETGWRQFSEADVEAAKAWLAENSKSRRKRPQLQHA